MWWFFFNLWLIVRKAYAIEYGLIDFSWLVLESIFCLLETMINVIVWYYVVFFCIDRHNICQIEMIQRDKNSTAHIYSVHVCTRVDRFGHIFCLSFGRWRLRYFVNGFWIESRCDFFVLLFQTWMKYSKKQIKTMHSSCVQKCCVWVWLCWLAGWFVCLLWLHSSFASLFSLRLDSFVHYLIDVFVCWFSFYQLYVCVCCLGQCKRSIYIHIP